MRKIVILLIACMMVSVSFLCGCNEQDNDNDENDNDENDNTPEVIDIKESIKGQWGAYQSETSYVFTFYDDGTCKYSFGLYIMGKYYVVGDRLECHFEDVALVGDFQNFYDIEMPDDDTLILTTKGSGELTHDGRLEYSRWN